MKRQPLKRSDVGLVAKKKINAKSKHRKKEDAENHRLRKRYREEHPYCEIGIVIAISDPIGGAPWCTLFTQGIHERKKRSHQGSLIDLDNLMAACSPCNSWVECNPVKAWNLGLVVYSYEELSERYVYRGNP